MYLKLLLKTLTNKFYLNKLPSDKGKANFIMEERMARPIAPTPKLDAKQTRKFLAKVDEGLKNPMGPVPTPKVAEAIKKVMADARGTEK